jgi:hypothetical protein
MWITASISVPFGLSFRSAAEESAFPSRPGKKNGCPIHDTASPWHGWECNPSPRCHPERSEGSRYPPLTHTHRIFSTKPLHALPTRHKPKGRECNPTPATIAFALEGEPGFSPASKPPRQAAHRSAEGRSEAQRVKRLNHCLCFCRCCCLCLKTPVKPPKIISPTKQTK